jgi:hypothetical protein
MKIKNILVSCVLIFGSLSLSGCYTQLSMFYPEPEIEQESEFSDFFQSYSKAPPRPNLTLSAQDGAGQPLGLAYMTMTNRFNFYGGNYMGNRFNNGYYWNEYNLGGYTMYIPYSDPYAAIYATGERKQRTFIRTRDGSSPKTNLTVTRTRSTQSSSSNNNTYTNSSNVSSNRSSSEGSSSSSSSSSSSGRRATKRN